MKNNKKPIEKHDLHVKRGDVVRIVESRPMSGDKRWVIAEVVETAK